MYIQNPGLQILEFIVFIWQMYTSLKHRETLTEEFPSPSVSNDVFPPVLFPQNDAEHLLSVSHGAAVSGHLWIHRLWQQLHDPTSYGLMMTSTQKKKTPDWKCEEINILPRFQPRLFRAGCENASRLILYVVLAYLKTLINHYNVLNLKCWCFKCIYVFARMVFCCSYLLEIQQGRFFIWRRFFKAYVVRMPRIV